MKISVEPTDLTREVLAGVYESMKKKSYAFCEAGVGGADGWDQPPESEGNAFGPIEKSGAIEKRTN